LVYYIYCMIRTIWLFIVISSPLVLYGQGSDWGKIPSNINRSGANNFNPILSGDALKMIYLSDIAQGEGVRMWYTKRIKGGWAKQEVIDQQVDNFKVNTEGGYFLDLNGKTLVFSSKRYGSMGGYDIWTVVQLGNVWNQPGNAGKPVNTTLHEGDASLSVDGKYLYFSRCESMSQTNADGCKILMAKRKPNGYFEDPVELPSPINTGNETAPKMLADGKTMVFASKRNGGRGGWDLYQSRFEYEQWSDPVNMRFINTDLDDRYVSMPARGDIIYLTRKIKGFRNLVFTKIPLEFQQKYILWINGKVEDSNGSPVNSFIQFASWPDRKVERVLPEDDGSFVLILTEGHDYDVAVMDKEGEYTFSSMFLDLAVMNNSERKRLSFVLDRIEDSSTFYLNNMLFDQSTSELAYYSDFELERLIYLMKKHGDFNTQITTYRQNYIEDSIRSNPDLTEVIIDTIINTEIIERIDTVFNEFIDMEADSLISELVEVDSAISELVEMDSAIFESDSLNVSEPDSLQTDELSYTIKISYDTLVTETINMTYHNDRTLLQSEAIKNYIVQKGAPEERIIIKGDIKPNEGIIERMLKLDRDYLVEVTFLQN